MRIFTSKALFTLATALMLASAHDASAQENTILGYTNVYTKLIATPNGAGQVCANTSTTGLKIFKDEFDFKQTLPVNHMFVQIGDNSAYTDYITYYLHAKPTEGFTFAGWYKDDGDGQLDTNKDELLSTEADYPYFVELDAEEITLYNTSSEASKGEFPETPTVIFGHFTQGAVVSLSYYQDADNANCGSVFIDKLANAPGDQVTVRAIPNDGFKFEYWEDSRLMGNVVSTENPYTFTVQGGERLYAYFTAINAPVAELPEEGGFKVMYLDAPWVMTDESMKNGAHIIVLEKEDFTRDAEGRTYLNMDNEDVWIDVGQHNKLPTIISGKGTVRFAYKLNYGIARKYADQTLVRWSGDAGVTLEGENFYVYVFDETLGAFLQYANTDMVLNPSASNTVKVEGKRAYFWMFAYDIADSQGNIPTVIALSPETFDNAIATAIDNPQIETVEVKGQKIYTLSGVEVKSTDQKGIYIINGKKVLVK